MRPVCVPCGREMKCVKNGALLTHDNRVWSADAFECGECGARVIKGFGAPMLQDDHRKLLEDSNFTVELKEWNE